MHLKATDAESTHAHSILALLLLWATLLGPLHLGVGRVQVTGLLLTKGV